VEEEEEEEEDDDDDDDDECRDVWHQFRTADNVSVLHVLILNFLLGE
jgi:hypothetical protein